MSEFNLDYGDLFAHVENLPKVLLVACGMSGADFFQSLLDGHSQILQFTGNWCFHKWWRRAKCKQNLPDLINEFIWYADSDIGHIGSFKSRYKKIERWDQLGRNKDESFEVDIDAFSHHMLKIFRDRELNSRNFFLAVNLSYGLATKVNISETNLVFYNIHRMEVIQGFMEDFTKFDIICTIREPRNTLATGIESWKGYDISTYNSTSFLSLLVRIFNEAGTVMQNTVNIKTLKLEDLHLHTKEIMEELCESYGLQLEECLFESTFHRKKWWGDALSGKYLDGINKNFKENKWNGKLFWYDNFLIKFILEDRLKHYGYSPENRMSKMYLIPAILLSFLPMKYELKIIIHNFLSRGTIKGKVASIKNGGESYLLRIFLYLGFVLKKIRKEILLPDFFTQEKYRINDE